MGHRAHQRQRRGPAAEGVDQGAERGLPEQRRVAVEHQHRTAHSLERAERGPDRVRRPPLRRLRREAEGLAREAGLQGGAHLVPLVPDHRHHRIAAQGQGAAHRPRRQRLPEHRVQHLGLLGLHAGALARAEHHRRQRFGHRGQPHCKGAAAGVKRHHLLRGGSGDVADRQRSDTAPLNVGVARPGPGAGQRRGPAGPRARGPRRGAAERAGGGRRPRGA